jgi:hypothetical protein
MTLARTVAALAAAFLCDAMAQSLVAPDCGSVVIIRCDKDAGASTDSDRRAAARRQEARRIRPEVQELDRIIIEGDAERSSLGDTINRALARPLLLQRESTFSLGEGELCTCRAVCPPPPLPCCVCSDRVGSRHATSPGWKPTN